MIAPKTEVLISVHGVVPAQHLEEHGEHEIGRMAECAIQVEVDIWKLCAALPTRFPK